MVVLGIILFSANLVVIVFLRGFFQSPGNSRFDKINKLDLKVIGSIGRFHVTYLF